MFLRNGNIYFSCTVLFVFFCVKFLFNENEDHAASNNKPMFQFWNSKLSNLPIWILLRILWHHEMWTKYIFFKVKRDTNPITIYYIVCMVKITLIEQLPQTAKKNLQCSMWELSHIICFLILKAEYDIMEPHILQLFLFFLIFAMFIFCDGDGFCKSWPSNIEPDNVT